MQATVQSDYAGMPRAMPSDYAQAGASEQQMPRAMPSDYAASDDSVEPRFGVTREQPRLVSATTQAVGAWDRERPRITTPSGDGTRPEQWDRGRSRRRDGGPRPLHGDRERPRRSCSGTSRRRWHDHRRTKHGCGGRDRGWSAAHDRSGRLRGTPYARAKARVVRRTDGPVPRPICVSLPSADRLD